MGKRIGRESVFGVSVSCVTVLVSTGQRQSALGVRNHLYSVVYDVKDAIGCGDVSERKDNSVDRNAI